MDAPGSVLVDMNKQAFKEPVGQTDMTKFLRVTMVTEHHIRGKGCFFFLSPSPSTRQLNKTSVNCEIKMHSQTQQGMKTIN